MNKEIVHNIGDLYIVTGIYANTNRRFKPMMYSNPHFALSVNLWRGSVWQKKVGSKKRTLIKRVYN